LLHQSLLESPQTAYTLDFCGATLLRINAALIAGGKSLESFELSQVDARAALRSALRRSVRSTGEGNDAMPAAAPSILSLGAAGLYALVLGVCLLAAMTATSQRQPFAHRRTWVLIAFAFGLFALLRIAGFEEMLRDLLRSELRLGGGYNQRRALQRPLAFVISAVVGVMFAWGLWRQWRAAQGRRNMALFVAFAALTMMVMLLGLRIVSLHQIDVLLYGPAKLNWVIDIGASLTVLTAAGFYIRLVSHRP
jgi:cation transport ATPase